MRKPPWKFVFLGSLTTVVAFAVSPADRLPESNAQALDVTAGRSGPTSLLGSGDNILRVLDTNLDRPTLHALGVQVLIAGDENRNARIAVRYRSPGGPWRSAMDLFRALPLAEWSFVLPPQFNGSIFDLTPGSIYELELNATDPDGNVNLTWTITGATRTLPRRDPASPRVVPVTSSSTFNSALANAQPGDIILLAPGTYNGPFKMTASGTAENPIVIRGQTASQAIIDGGGCYKTCQALLPDGSNSKDCCNGLELTGDHLHVESLTIRNVERALSFEGTGLNDIVARRIVARDVDHGIASGPGDDGYFCDNDLEGHLLWPWVFDTNPNQYWDRRGIDVAGDGQVVCYNRLKGFGDPVVNKKFRSRGWDAYGNDIIDTWDGTELDEAEANARMYLNRFTNVMAPISMQPAYGGPLYAIRNVALNAAQEQVKLKSYGGIYEPSGGVILHNTFVSPRRPLSIAASIVQYNSILENNLFVGPAKLPADGRAVSWDVRIIGVGFDYNGYYPNGKFYFRSFDGVALPTYPNFLALQASGLFEQHGALLTTPIFEKGFVGPANKWLAALPGDFRLAASSNAIDRGRPLRGINSNFTGTGPDLGAIERGCPAPLYGPRPPAQEQYVAAIDCRLGDTVKPAVSIVSPAPDATVGGTVTVRADATDNIGVARVEFLVDGSLTSTDTTVAYEFQWNTAGVANGNHTLLAKAFDGVGNFETSAPVQVTVNNVSSGKRALFVVGTTPLTAPDTALSNRLTTLGFTVVAAKSATVTAAAAADKTLVVLSDSVAPASVNTKFKAIAKPVLVLEPNLFDDMAMTGKVAGTDYGTKASQTQVAISGTHPLAAGLAGKVKVVTVASAFHWGKPAVSAAIGAKAATGTQATSFGYEAGSSMVGYTAPGRRAGLFTGTAASTKLNANGWKLFDAAVRWIAGL